MPGITYAVKHVRPWLPGLLSSLAHCILLAPAQMSPCGSAFVTWRRFLPDHDACHTVLLLIMMAGLRLLQFAGEALRVQNVPMVVLAPAIGTIGGAVRGLLPWG